jgi:hypothetical protein
MRCDVVALAHRLGEAASSLFSPGNILVVDESIYEFNGDCPVRRYIPRKPHPNGLLVYCLAGFINVGADRIPIVLDIEPYMLGNEVGAQEAMLRLHARLRTRRPHLRPHLVVDSAFGSFDRLDDINEAGGDATMSMASNVKSWLWEMLDWDCGIDEGRTAFLPDKNVLVTSFKVMSETQVEHQIKTISTGCEVEQDSEAQGIVLKVSARREAGDQFEYLAHFVGGQSEWLLARSFIGDDGTTNISWLTFAKEDDLKSAFETFTLAQLRAALLHSGASPADDLLRARLETDRRQGPSCRTGCQEVAGHHAGPIRGGVATRKSNRSQDLRGRSFRSAPTLLYQQLLGPRSV